MNKNKQYFKLKRCEVCGCVIIATYNPLLIKWVLKCGCGLNITQIDLIKNEWRVI